MNENIEPYKWSQFKDGFIGFAIVTLKAEPSIERRNKIIENYSGQGFTSQGYIEEVPAIGYIPWKLGVKSGLEYAFSLLDTFWNVRIDKVEGIGTDTNATIAGYTALRAFMHQINFMLSQEEIDKLETFVQLSWKSPSPNRELIPNFFDLSFEAFSV